MLQGPGHSKYWSVSSTSSTGGFVPGIDTEWNYPKWQTTVTLFSFPAVFHRVWEWVSAWWRLNRSVQRLSTEQIEAVTRISSVLAEPVYDIARTAVRQTAVKPVMRDHHYWIEVGRIAKAWNWGENIYRRLDANETADRMLRSQGSTCTHMVRELAVELAYGAYKARGR